MSRGLSLTDFRAQFESDAVKRCEQQEVTIKKLHETIASLRVQILAMQQYKDTSVIDGLRDGIAAASDKDFIEKGALFMQRTTL